MHRMLFACFLIFFAPRLNDKFFGAGRNGAIDSDLAQVLAGSVVFGLKTMARPGMTASVWAKT